MSIKVMNLVWSNADANAGELLVLLALSDNADDLGMAYPGIAYIASKARMTTRNVQLCLAELQKKQYLTVTFNAGPNGTNKYQINIEHLEKLPEKHKQSRSKSGGEKFSPSESEGVKSAQEGVKSDAEGGEAHFTQTVIEPSEEPLNAHVGARESEFAHEGNAIENAAANKRPDAIVGKRAFRSFINNWPGFAGMSPASAERAWFALADDERVLAAARRDAWIALLRKQGKDHTPAPSTYLKERLWEAVKPEAVVATDRATAAPFGKAWMRHVILALNSSPSPLPPAPAFIAKQIADDTEIGRREALDRLARFGWPEVVAMFQRAEDGKGIPVAARDIEGLSEMEAVQVDSELFQAWRAAFEARGWPWFKVPSGVRYVWLPVGGPTTLDALTATSGKGETA